MGARVAGRERQFVIGDFLRVRDGLAAGRRVALVVEQEMIEIRRRLFGNRREHSEAHQDVALGIEQHQLALGPGKGEPEAETGMAAHRRIAERCIEIGARPHVRLSTGRPVSQYAGNEDCSG